MILLKKVLEAMLCKAQAEVWRLHGMKQDTVRSCSGRIKGNLDVFIASRAVKCRAKIVE